jgi:hypothetical protein
MTKQHNGFHSHPDHVHKETVHGPNHAHVHHIPTKVHEKPGGTYPIPGEQQGPEGPGPAPGGEY